MKKILLAVALVLVMAIPAMSAVKPMPMNIFVYYDQPIWTYVCSVTPQYDYCQEQVCQLWFLGICLDWGWEARPLSYGIVSWTEQEINSATIGGTYRVKGTMFSELPKNVKYQLIIQNGITTVYKSARIACAPLDGWEEIQFDDFTFENPGLYTFTLQVIKPDGTIVKLAKKVFVPAPPTALEEVLEESEE